MSSFNAGTNGGFTFGMRYIKGGSSSGGPTYFFTASSNNGGYLTFAGNVTERFRVEYKDSSASSLISYVTPGSVYNWSGDNLIVHLSGTTITFYYGNTSSSYSVSSGISNLTINSINLTKTNFLNANIGYSAVYLYDRPLSGNRSTGEISQFLSALSSNTNFPSNEIFGVSDPTSSTRSGPSVSAWGSLQQSSGSLQPQFTTTSNNPFNGEPWITFSGNQTMTATLGESGGSSPPVPGAPQNLTATPLYGSLRLNWNIPSSNPEAVSTYKIYNQANALIYTTSSLTYTISNLTNNTLYTYSVKAVNSAGSESSPATVNGTPNAPSVASNTLSSADLSALTNNQIYKKPNNTLFIQNSVTPANVESVLGSQIQSLYNSDVKTHYLNITTNGSTKKFLGNTIKTSDTNITVNAGATSEVKVEIAGNVNVSGINATDVVLVSGLNDDSFTVSSASYGQFYMKIFDSDGLIRTSGFSIPITVFVPKTIGTAPTSLTVQKLNDSTNVFEDLVISSTTVTAARLPSSDTLEKYAYEYIATTNSQYNFIPTAGNAGGDPHILPVFGNSYYLPNEEKCFLLYDNQKEDRVIITAKCWFLPQNIKNNSNFKNHFMSDTTFFKYINIYYKGENLTIDMETLKQVKYTNMIDVDNCILENKVKLLKQIKTSQIFDDKLVLRKHYNLLKIKKYNIEFNGKSRMIQLGNDYQIKLSIDLNCADHRNDIQLIKATYENATGALINENSLKVIDYLIPQIN